MRNTNVPFSLNIVSLRVNNLHQGEERFSRKGQTINILGFKGHRVRGTSQLCIVKQPTDHKQVRLCSDKTLFTTTGSGPDLGCGL